MSEVFRTSANGHEVDFLYEPQEQALCDMTAQIRETNPQAFDHCLAVGEGAEELCRLAGKDFKTRWAAYVAGFLHDIGKGNKLFIEVLEGYTDYEKDENARKLYDTHPDLGGDILDSKMDPKIFGVEFTDIVKLVTRYHHTNELLNLDNPVVFAKLSTQFPAITDWSLAFDTMSSVQISDETHSRTGTRPGKIPPRPYYLPMPITKATQEMRAKFGYNGDSKFPIEFLPTFELWCKQLEEYKRIMPGTLGVAA